MRQKPPQPGGASSAEGWEAGRQELMLQTDREEAEVKALWGGEVQSQEFQRKGKTCSEECRGLQRWWGGS